MCFIIYRNRKPKVLIAKKDIVVYKSIRTSGFGAIYSLRIAGRKEKWIKGTHYWQTIPFKIIRNVYGGTRYEVHENAFHSFIEKPYYQSYNRKIITCYIPKGAKYLKNYEQYVSSAIVYP